MRFSNTSASRVYHIKTPPTYPRTCAYLIEAILKTQHQTEPSLCILFTCDTPTLSVSSFSTSLNVPVQGIACLQIVHYKAEYAKKMICFACPCIPRTHCSQVFAAVNEDSSNSNKDKSNRRQHSLACQGLSFQYYNSFSLKTTSIFMF